MNYGTMCLSTEGVTKEEEAKRKALQVDFAHHCFVAIVFFTDKTDENKMAKAVKLDVATVKMRFF